MKKQSQTIHALLLVITAGSIFGCGTSIPPDPYYVDPDRQKSNVYYTPSTPNVPMLNKKNSFLLSPHYGGNREFKNFDLHAAYMPWEKIGFIAAFRHSTYKESLYIDDLGSSSGVEFGAGYVAPSKTNLHFEAYAGIGTNNLFNMHHTGDSKTNFTSYFIQPAFYITDEKNIVQFSLIPRFTLNNFTIHRQDFDFDREPLVDEQFNILEKNPNHYFFEPTALLRIGGESVKFQLSYTLSKNLTSGNLQSSGRNISLGMVFKSK